VLHNREPEKPEAVNELFPQLLTIAIVGAMGIVFGAAIPLPAALTQPFAD
jgi:hypothetical protein